MKRAIPIPIRNPYPAPDMMDESIYERLHCRAKAMLRNEACGHCLEPADLVHEAFLRIARSHVPIPLHDRVHLMAVATIVMRHILIDYSRSPKSPWRFKVIPLDCELPISTPAPGNDLPLHDALQRLANCEERLYRIVEMRFFWGLGIEEIAATLSVSSRTVKRHWTAARVWLRRELDRSAIA